MSDGHICDTASERLELANRAALEADWSSLCQHLHQLVQQPAHCTPEAIAQWQDLAQLALERGDFHIRWDVAKLMARPTPELSLVRPQKIVARLEALDVEAMAEEGEDDGLLWFLVRILGELGDPDSIPALVALLHRTPEEDITAAVVTALGQIGAPAIPAVCELLDTPQTRPAAVQALAQIRHPDAVAPLTRAVKDANPEIRALAVATLADAQHPEAYAILVEALGDVASTVRRAALRGLGSPRHHNSPATLAKMGGCLWDINLSVRQAAALALGRTHLPQAAALLFRALQAPETPPVLQPQLIGALVQTETAVGITHLTQYAKAQHAAHGLDGTPVAAIATSLGRVEAPTLVPQALALLEMLLAWTPPTDPIRCAIAASLGQLSPACSRQIELLIAMLAEADTSLRLHVLAALRKLAPTEGRQRLRAIADAPRTAPRLRQAVLQALQDWDYSMMSKS